MLSLALSFRSVFVLLSLISAISSGALAVSSTLLYTFESIQDLQTFSATPTISPEAHASNPTSGPTATNIVHCFKPEH